MLRFFLLSCLFITIHALGAQTIYPNIASIKTYQLAPASVDVSSAHRISLSDPTSEASKVTEALRTSLESVLRLTTALTAERADLVDNDGKGTLLKIAYSLEGNETYTLLLPVFKLNGFYQVEEKLNARFCKTLSCDQEVQFEATTCSCGGEDGELRLLNSSM